MAILPKVSNKTLKKALKKYKCGSFDKNEINYTLPCIDDNGWYLTYNKKDKTWKCFDEMSTSGIIDSNEVLWRIQDDIGFHIPENFELEL